VTTEEKPKLNCRHGWPTAERDTQRSASSWLPCPFCKPEAARVLQGGPKTPQEAVELGARRKSNASLGIQQPSRTLELSGKTLAGCAVGKMAADSTANTRFHSVLACGHAKIIDGTVLTTADRAGKILKCPPCNRADAKAAKEAKRKAQSDG